MSEQARCRALLEAEASNADASCHNLEHVGIPQIHMGLQCDVLGIENDCGCVASLAEHQSRQGPAVYALPCVTAEAQQLQSGA